MQELLNTNIVYLLLVSCVMNQKDLKFGVRYVRYRDYLNSNVFAMSNEQKPSISQDLLSSISFDSN